VRGRETAHLYGRSERTEQSRKENTIQNRFGNPILIQSFFDRISNRRMLHQHGDRLELCIIDSGEGSFQLGRTKHRVRAGSLIICNPDMLHGLSVDGPLYIDCYSVTIAGLQIENLPENYLIPDTALPVLDLTGETAFTMRSMFRLLHLHEKSGTDSSSEICNMLLYTIFMLIRDWMSGNGQIYRKNENSNTGKIAGEILDYLEQHYLEITNLDKVAADLHLSKSYIAHIFHKETGKSPIQWCIERRIGDAQSLLTETRLSVGQIQEQTGFSSSSHFSQVFKKYVGVTPTEYRDTHILFDPL